MDKMDLKIVVFGCDNTGKTTLCEYLNNKFTENGMECELAKSIGANKEVDEYLDFMDEKLTSEHIVIFDRFPVIEESTCGRVIRGKDIFEDCDDSEMLNYITSVDVFLFCYPGLFNTLNWGSREQMDGVKDNVTKLIDAYNQMALALVNLGCLVVEYNYKVNTPEEVYDEINRMFIMQEEE